MDIFGKARKRGEKGVKARSRYYLIDYKRFIWSPCTIVDYNRKTDTFELEWADNGARKYVKRSLLSLIELIQNFHNNIFMDFFLISNFILEECQYK